MKSMDLYRAFGGIDDALLEQSEAFGEASFKEVRVDKPAKGNAKRGGNWFRKYGSLVALLAVCLAVGSFVKFGGGAQKMKYETPAAASSAPAMASEPAEAPAAPMPSAASYTMDVAAEESPEVPKTEEGIELNSSKAAGTPSNGVEEYDGPGPEAGTDEIPRLEDIERGGIFYILADDEGYSLGEDLGEEIDGWKLYAVADPAPWHSDYITQQAPEDMLALYDPVTGRTYFYKSVSKE